MLRACATSQSTAYLVDRHSGVFAPIAATAVCDGQSALATARRTAADEEEQPQTHEAPDQGSGIKELEIPVRRDEQI